MGKPNRNDVAELAGVSVAVVSYVVNNGPRPVADATRDRVLAAMKQLSYRPNPSARALKLSKTHVLGLLVPDIANPFHSEFASHLQDQAYNAGYALIMGSAGQDGSQEASQLRSMIDRGVDGILAFGFHRASTMEEMLASGIPVVSLDWRIHEGSVPTVAVDDYGATRLAIDHLLGHGHAEVGFIGGHFDATARQSAWRDAMKGLVSAERQDQIAAFGDFTMLGGYEAARDLFTRPTPPPRALFVSADVQAMGALRALGELGVRVPDDVAIVSFDGTMASQFTSPSLTAVRFPSDVMARRALQRVTGPTERELHVTVPHTLIVRESCGNHSPATAH